MITQCYVCGQFRRFWGWDGIKKAVNRSSRCVSHGLCPKCFESESDRLSKEAKYLKNASDKN